MMKENSSDIVIMIVSVTIILLILLVFIIFFSFLYKSRQAKHQREMQSVVEQYNQEVLKAQLEIREQTLKNISEEIHDNVGQVLSLAVLNLSAIELHDTTKAATRIERITGLVEKAVADLRNLSKTMDPGNITVLGLSAVIAFELEMLEKSGIYKTKCSISGQERKLHGSVETVIYRLIQESLNNVIKHAKATQIEIQLNYSDKELAVQVTDNGKGFDQTQLNWQDIHYSGAGIRNMKNRAQMIGATLSIGSIPGAGTKINLMVPFDGARTIS